MRVRTTVLTTTLTVGALAALGLTGCRHVDTSPPPITLPSTALPIPPSLLPIPSFSRPGTSAADRLRDAEITACAVDSHGLPYAEVKITNSTRWTASYFVAVSFFDAAGNRLDKNPGNAVGQNIPAGGTVVATTSGIEFAPDRTVTCKVVDVHRYEQPSG